MGFVNVGDVDLYYEEKGAGTPILLIPPSGATASTWGELVDDLAAVGRVIAYDRRGYTRSGGGILRDASTHTRDAAGLLEALAATPAVVVGTSAGATIALDLAVRRPDLVHAVVAHEAPWRALLHPAAPGLAALARMQWLAWQGRYADATEVLLHYVYSYRDGGSAWDAFPDEWRQVARRNGRAVLADLRATLGSYPRNRDLAGMTTPVVCSYGARSGNYMHATTRALANAIPTATLREVEGAAHAAPFDAPVQFTHVIAAALTTSAARAGTDASSPSAVTASAASRLQRAAFRESAIRRRPRQLWTAVRAVKAGLARGRRDPWRQSPAVDGAALRDLVATVAADARLVTVPANRPPWTHTHLAVTAGDDVTWLSWGAAYLVRPLGVGVRPRLVLRGRIGEGPPQRSTDDTMTFTADRDGELALGSAMPGEMQLDGTVTTDHFPYQVASGQIMAAVVRWAPGTDPRQALESIADRDSSGLCAGEGVRLAQPLTPPSGWDMHPLIGDELAFSRTEDGISAHGDRTVSIIRHPAHVPLTPTLQLRWSWRVDELPSRLPEDTTLTHDYLSVALEFDDGRDLTWYWSSGLPEGSSYPCPLPHWRRRETHVVVRTGTAGLGRWLEEERPVLADHQAAIGGPAPARVVRAWLISCTFPQAGRSAGEFRRIELVDGDQTVRVL